MNHLKRRYVVRPLKRQGLNYIQIGRILCGMNVGTIQNPISIYCNPKKKTIPIIELSLWQRIWKWIKNFFTGGEK
jgi:hypothetical protein